MSLLQTLKFITSHPLNAGHPVKALARFARWQIESRLKDEVEFDWIEGSKLIARNGMTGATGNIYCGLHEFADMAFVMHLLRPGDLFVDVGANIGSYTVLASAVCGARVIAIEPDPNTMQALRENIIANAIEDQVTLVESAVGAKEGTVSFTVGQDTTNRVATVGDELTREVRVRTLDEILDNKSPTCIKMDVEGYEAEVMAGARDTLRNKALRAILLETVEPQIEQELTAAGFGKFYYDPLSRDLSDVSLARESQGPHNTLFLRLDGAIQERLKSAPMRTVQGVSL